MPPLALPSRRCRRDREFAELGLGRHGDDHADAAVVERADGDVLVLDVRVRAADSRLPRPLAKNSSLASSAKRSAFDLPATTVAFSGLSGRSGRVQFARWLGLAVTGLVEAPLRRSPGT